MSSGTERQRFRFPATRRLKLAREFERVRKGGRSIRGGVLTLGVLRPEDETGFRVGFVTSRRLGGAVVRNRVRRRLREIVRKRQHELVAGLWFVVIARPAAAEATAEVLEQEWERLGRRAGIFSDSCS